MTGADIEITFLGTGSTIPPNNRQQVSFALRQAVGLILFDCGEGTQYSLRRYGVSIRREIVICISHLHADHFLGLPGLISSLQLLDRQEPVKIVGPVGIEQTVKNLLLANYIVVEYPLIIHELQPGQIFKSKGYRIQAIKAKHEGNALSFIYRENDMPGKIDIDKVNKLGIPHGPLLGRLQNGEDISFRGNTITPDMVMGPRKKGRIVVYSGDTAYSNELIGAIPRGCNLLVHEGTYPSERVDLAIERNHSTTVDAANVAHSAKVDQLIITHLSPRIENFDEEMTKAQKIFLNTEFAYEGMVYIIPYPR